MIWIVVVFFVGVTLATIFLVKTRKKPDGEDKPPQFLKKTALLNTSQLAFKQAAEKALSAEFDLYSKVRLADLLGVPDNLQRNATVSAENQLLSHYVDCVVCDRETAQIRVIILLGDKTQSERAYSQQANFVNQALTTAQSVVLHFDLLDSYEAETIYQRVHEVLGPTITMEEGDISGIKVFIEPDEEVAAKL